jgi:hypothetical protein
MPWIVSGLILWSWRTEGIAGNGSHPASTEIDLTTAMSIVESGDGPGMIEEPGSFWVWEMKHLCALLEVR